MPLHQQLTKTCKWPSKRCCINTFIFFVLRCCPEIEYDYTMCYVGIISWLLRPAGPWTSKASKLELLPRAF